MIDLSGKAILITGGGRGIGAAIVRTVIQAGGRAVLHDLQTAGGPMQLQKELGKEQCLLVAGDLADGASVGKVWGEAVAWCGRVDVLVNNAGIYETADVDFEFERWSESWHRTLAINLVAPAHFCREAIRHFRQKGGGIIINIASRAAFRGDDPDYMHYAASKAGVVAMTRTIARHFGRQNITAFAVAPGFVRTNLNDKVIAAVGIEAILESIPLGEMAEPEDIANTVAFLASGLARHATGATFDLNGASYVR